MILALTILRWLLMHALDVSLCPTLAPAQLLAASAAASSHAAQQSKDMCRDLGGMHPGMVT